MNHIFNGQTTVSNATVVLNGRTVVNTNVTLNNCHIFMGKDAVIDIYNGKSLTLGPNTIIEACGDDMWDAIEIRRLANLHANGATIRDAKAAVRSLNGGYYNLHSTSFINNLIGIDVTPHRNQGTHPGTYVNCEFRKNSTLKRPYNGSQSVIGIRVKNVDYIELGLACNDQYNFNDWSEFVNLDFGIHADQSGGE